MKKLFRLLSLISFLLFSHFELHAQGTPTVPAAGVSITNPIPASPDAAALGKYGSIPVGPYTGTANISIPLYTIRSGDLSLPVSLSYHSSGNKTEEMASSVGLGWALNAGGVITRSIRGLADEEYGGFLTQNSASEIKNSTANIDYYLNATADGTLDSEPDVYNYNFAGYSGQFIMDAQGHITVIPLANIVFTFNVYSDQTTYINSFTAKTPDGVTYYFGTNTATGPLEFTKSAGKAQYHAMSWYLYKIISPSYHEIDLTYTYESYDFSTVAQQTFYQWIGSTGCWGNNCEGGIKNAPQNVTTQLSSNNFNNVKLSSITFENGSLQVYSNMARNDILHAKCVDTIAITSGNFSKLYKFYYLNAATNRLRLDSLIGQLEPIAGTSGYKKEKYSFIYNPDAWNGNYLFMYSQDYWGYYNGATNQYQNQGILVPQITATINNVPVQLFGANRAPNETSMQSGMLTQITYPTGGYTKFTYEGNRDHNHDVGNNDVVCSAQHVVGFSNDSTARYFNYNVINGNPHSIMHVDSNGSSPIAITVSAWGLGNANIQGFIYSYNPTTGDSTVYTVVNNTGTSDLTAHDSTILVVPGTYKLVCKDPHGQLYNPGNPYGYKIGMSAIWCTWVPAHGPDTANNYPAGGLRIKQIADYDGVSPNPVNLRTYKYTVPDSTSSSGWLDFNPVYYFQLNIETTVVQGNAPYASWIDEYLTRSSTSNYPLATTQGSVVGYSHVEELLGPNGINGKNEYFYTNSQTVADLLQSTGTGFPFAPPASRDWLRGLLLKQTTWKNTGSGTFTKLTEKGSAFTTIKKNFSSYGIKAGFNPKPYNYNQYNSYFVLPAVYELGRVQYCVYSLYTDYTYLSSDTTRIYEPADQTKFQQTISRYKFDTTTYQLTQLQTTTSKNELITQVITHPNDYLTFATPTNGSLVGIQNLYNMGITTYPIEEIMQRSDANGSNLRTVKAVLTTYKPNRAYRDSVFEMRSVAGVPNFVISSPGTNDVIKDSHYQPVVAFTKYDLYGNILQENQVGAPTHAYIWGYNDGNYPHDNTYPIAEIINNNSDSVAYTNFEQLRNSGTTWGNWTFVYPGITTDNTAPMGASCYSLSAIDTMGKGGLITANSYVVSFWAKSGAAVTITGSTGSTITNVATGNPKSGWTYYEYSVTGTTKIKIGGTGLIDEVRLYPSTAQMSTYTYTPLMGVASKCDTKNDITYFVYDNVGRLIQVLDQNRNIVKQYQYNYKNSDH